MSTPRPQPHDASSPTRTVHAADVVRFLRRGLPLALLAALLAGAAAFLVARATDPVYRAGAALLAADPALPGGDVPAIAPPDVDAAAYRAALLEGPVVANAVERLDGERPGEARLEAILRTIEVDVDAQQVSSVVRIDVEHTDPARAAALANALAEELIVWDRARARDTFASSLQAIESEIGRIDAELARADLSDERRVALQALRNQRAQEIGLAEAGGDRFVVVSRLAPLRVAAPPELPVRPRLVFDTFVAAVVGLVVAYALLYLRAATDRRLRGREDLEAASGLPVLAEFPRRTRGNRELASDSVGFFHTRLLLAAGEARPLVVVITSPATPDEKAGVAVALAESFARAGHRTLLVDGDLRRPGATEGLDVRTKQSAPFEVHLENPDRRYAPATVAIGGKGTFDFVPSFTAARYPVELLARGLAAQLAGWRESYDVILLDATPVLPFADTLAMVPHADGVVLCASAEGTRGDAVEESLELLARADAPVLGTVLTNAGGPRHAARAPRADEVRAGEGGRKDPYRTLAPAPERPRAGAAERR